MSAAPLLLAALSMGCAVKPTLNHPQVQETMEQFAKRVCDTLGAGKHVSQKINVSVECHEFGIMIGGSESHFFDLHPKKIKLNLENAAEYFKNKKVVVAGEDHQLKNDNDTFLKLLPIFKQQGFTDLGLELDIEWQDAIDKYAQDGDEKNLAFLDDFIGGEGFIEIIKLAKTLGLKCTCIDVRQGKYYPGVQGDTQAFWDRRDQYMFENVEKIFQAPGRKVVCFNGVGHADYEEVTYFLNGINANGMPHLVHMNKPLGFRLRKKYGQENVGLIDLTGCDEENATYACFESTGKKEYYEMPTEK